MNISFNKIHKFKIDQIIYRLETYIGKKLNWKHLFRLETKKKYIGNKLLRLETEFLDWKP